MWRRLGMEWYNLNPIGYCAQPNKSNEKKNPKKDFWQKENLSTTKMYVDAQTWITQKRAKSWRKAFFKMSTKCDILFENNFEKVYYGGQLLSGQAIITLTKEKSVRGKYIIVVNKMKSKRRKCEYFSSQFFWGVCESVAYEGFRYEYRLIFREKWKNRYAWCVSRCCYDYVGMYVYCIWYKLKSNDSGCWLINDTHFKI